MYRWLCCHPPFGREYPSFPFPVPTNTLADLGRGKATCYDYITVHLELPFREARLGNVSNLEDSSKILMLPEVRLETSNESSGSVLEVFSRSSCKTRTPKLQKRTCGNGRL